jgi:hypothetical protein
MNLSGLGNHGNRENVPAPVFDRGRPYPVNPEIRAGLQVTSGGALFGAFRRTWRDRPGIPVTGKLLGDPAPGRAVPKIPEERKPGSQQDFAPVYLKFRDYEAALVDGSYAHGL